MCEFKVLLDGKQIMEEVIFAMVKDDIIILRDIIGDEKKVVGAKIIEINVPSTKMILESM